MLTKEGIKTIALSFGDTVVTGKDAIITGFTINHSNNIDTMYSRTEGFIKVPTAQTVEIEVSMICSGDNFVYEHFFGEQQSNKISKKKVEDCTVQELLFAARQKAGGKK